VKGALRWVSILTILTTLLLGLVVYAESQRAQVLRDVIQTTAVVDVESADEEALGSATVIGTRNGYSFLLTCHHVIEVGNIITVHPYQRKPPMAFVEIDSPSTDLALLVVHETLPVLPIAAFPPALYDAVYVVGAPNGQAWTASEGMLTLLDYGLEGQLMYRVTNALMQPGVSGGTATNDRGELIGVPARASASTPQQGLLIRLAEITSFVKGYAGASQ
jgi:S1-C subfamily serine protease